MNARRFVISMCLIGLSGCFGPAATPSSHFYRLAPVAAASSLPHRQALAIGVGPVEIAQYLDQAQMVTRQGDYEMTLHEYNRWAAPLRNLIPAVLREDLSVRLGTDQVLGYPWLEGFGEPEYQITVDVLRFDCSAALHCSLLAFWAIADLKQHKKMAVRRTELTTVANSGDYADMTNALSELLGRLADEMAGILSPAPRASRP